MNVRSSSSLELHQKFHAEKKKPDEFHEYEVKNIVVEEAKRNMKLFSHNKLQGKCFIVCIF